MPEVGCVALTLAKAEFRQEVENALLDLIGPVRAEAGVLQYEMHRDVSNPRQFVALERWQTLEHFEAHVKAPHVHQYLERTKGMVAHAAFHVLDRVD